VFELLSLLHDIGFICHMFNRYEKEFIKITREYEKRIITK
jgi:hypothetical protein